LLSTILHFYSISYGELMAMPMSAFWVLSKNVDRIRADEDKRFFRTVSNVIGGKPDRYMQLLDEEKGTVVELDMDTTQGFDKQGMSKLKAMMRMAR
jgi:hypothetical protein